MPFWHAHNARFPREKHQHTHRRPGPQRHSGLRARDLRSSQRQEYCARARTPSRRPPAAPLATPPAVPPTAAPGRLYWAAAAAREFAESDTRAAPSPRAADAHSSCAPSTRRASTAPEPLPIRQRTVNSSRPPTPAPPSPPPPPPDDEAIANATRMPPRSGPSGDGDSPPPRASRGSRSCGRSTRAPPGRPAARLPKTRHRANGRDAPNARRSRARRRRRRAATAPARPRAAGRRLTGGTAHAARRRAHRAH